jgi:hypothetical protein
MRLRSCAKSSSAGFVWRSTVEQTGRTSLSATFRKPREHPRRVFASTQAESKRQGFRPKNSSYGPLRWRCAPTDPKVSAICRRFSWARRVSNLRPLACEAVRRKPEGAQETAVTSQTRSGLACLDTCRYRGFPADLAHQAAPEGQSQAAASILPRASTSQAPTRSSGPELANVLTEWARPLHVGNVREVGNAKKLCSAQWVREVLRAKACGDPPAKVPALPLDREGPRGGDRALARGREDALRGQL